MRTGASQALRQERGQEAVLPSVHCHLVSGDSLRSRARLLPPTRPLSTNCVGTHRRRLIPSDKQGGPLLCAGAWILMRFLYQRETRLSDRSRRELRLAGKRRVLWGSARAGRKAQRASIFAAASGSGHLGASRNGARPSARGLGLASVSQAPCAHVVSLKAPLHLSRPRKGLPSGPDLPPQPPSDPTWQSASALALGPHPAPSSKGQGPPPPEVGCGTPHVREGWGRRVHVRRRVCGSHHRCHLQGCSPPEGLHPRLCLHQSPGPSAGMPGAQRCRPPCSVPPSPAPGNTDGDGVGSLKFRPWSQSPPVTPGRHPAQHLRASSRVPQGQTHKSHSFCPRGTPGTGRGGGLILILYLGFKPSFLPTP